MYLQTFKIFRDIAETSSFSEAARRNDISQSAVSQQVRMLEEKYGVMMIERGKRNFSITPEGQVFLEASEQILETFEGIGKRIQELQNIVAGELRIATVFSIGLHELPPYLKEYRRKFPDVDVQVQYRRSMQIYPEVHEGAADIGLVAFPVEKKGLQVQACWRDKLVLICPPEHRLSRRRQVRFSDLEHEKLISFDPDLPTRKAIDRMLKERGVEVDRAMEFDNIETVKRAVEIESGVSIVPERTVESEVAAGSLAKVGFAEKEVWRTLGIITKRNRAVMPAQREFIALLKQGLERGDRPSRARTPQLVGPSGKKRGAQVKNAA